VHTGYGTKRQSASGPTAMHGFIDDLLGTITDLGFPGSGLTAVDAVVEKNGVAYLTHSFSTPPIPLTPGLVAMDITTFALSGTNCPYAITASAIANVGDRIVISGSPKPTGSTTSVAAYKPATGTWESWSGTLFTNAGPSSNVNSILAYSCEGSCSYAMSVTGNFQNGTLGNTASAFTHIAKSCHIGGALPIKLLSFKVELKSSNAILHWEIAEAENGSKFELEKSKDGTHFNVITTQTGDALKKFFSFNDQNLAFGVSFYRLKMTDLDGKVTNSSVLQVNNSKNVIVTVYPNPSIRTGSMTMVSNTEVLSWKISNTAGQIVMISEQKQLAGSITIKAPPTSGTYFLEVTSASGKNVFQLVVQ